MLLEEESPACGDGSALHLAHDLLQWRCDPPNVQSTIDPARGARCHHGAADFGDVQLYDEATGQLIAMIFFSFGLLIIVKILRALLRTFRIYFPPLRVRAAFFADADLSAAERLRAAVRVCRDNASGEAAAALSRWRAFNVACDRLAEGFFPESAFSRSRCALRRVASEVLPSFGGANFTPARRALERPMAMACFVERAPCSPARISSISSRTNSPAWVEADFPSRLSRRARSMICFFGMIGTQEMLPADRSRK
jgi:hypothetical protein